MHDHEQALRRLQRRLAVAIACKYAVGVITWWIFLWGTAVLVLRAEAGTPRSILLWGAAGLPVAITIGVGLALRRLPSTAALRALVDQRGRCGGLVMAGHEVELAQWHREVPAVAETPVRWAGRRAWALLAMAVVFVAIAFWVPERFAGATTSTPLEIGDKVKKLAKQIQVLKEETILDVERAESLQQKLEQVRDDAKAKEPAKTLEALDHLRDVTKNTAKASAESSMRKTEELAKAETLAEGLRAAAPELDAKLLAEGMKELSSLMEKVAKENGGLDKFTENLKTVKLANLTPEQLKELAEALRGAKDKLADQLARLHEAGLIDLETLKQCENCGKCQAEALAELLKHCEGKSVCEMLDL
jgi:hypothetical protein